MVTWKHASLSSQQIRRAGMIGALLFAVSLFQLLTGGILLRPMNISNVLFQNAYLLILAPGMVLVMITGRLDLSVGSVVALIGTVVAVMIVDWNLPAGVAIVAALLLGTAIGSFHGYLISYLRMPMFVVTLAGMLIWRGLTLVVLEGETKTPLGPLLGELFSGYLPVGPRVGGLSSLTLIVSLAFSLLALHYLLRRRPGRLISGVSYEGLRTRGLLSFALFLGINAVGVALAAYRGIPWLLVIVVTVGLFYTFLAGRTTMGRRLYALGGNPDAARLSGVPTRRLLLLVYANNGFLAALAGLVVAGRLNAATPKAGTLFELDAITACLIGGAGMIGGIGTPGGAILGALVIGVLNNGMSLLGAGGQGMVKASIMLGAGLFDVYSRRR